MKTSTAGVCRIFFLLAGAALACNLSLRTPPVSPAPTPSPTAAGSSPTGRPSPSSSVPVEANWPPTVDEVLAECPTAAEIAEVDSKIRMSFEADPTAGTLVCAVANGSADLTREQKNAYNAILIMKELQFDAPLPWTDLPLYDWFTTTISAIRFRDDVSVHTCCGTPPTINIHAELHAFYSDRWTAVGGLMRILVHEARHTYMAHRCEGRDRTIDELGSYGVEARLNEWLAYHSDPAFLTELAPGPTGDYREEARFNFYSSEKNLFCLDPTPSAPPPPLPAAPAPGVPVWTDQMIRAWNTGIPIPVPLEPAADAAVPAKGAVFAWEGVEFPGGVTYGIEVDELFQFGREGEFWKAKADAAGLSEPRYAIPISFYADYTKAGRWRVWAISPTAGAGPKSEWRYFRIVG